jgi:hypothetical protein
MKTRLILEGSQAQIRSELSGNMVTIRFAAAAPSWLPVVRSLEFVEEVIAADSALRVNLANPQRDTPRLVRILVEAGAELYAVEPARKTLEEIYLELVDAATATDRESVADAP